MASGDQCAIGPDGKLLDAKDIEWRHDPDDPAPLSKIAQPKVPNPTIHEGKYLIVHALVHFSIMFNLFYLGRGCRIKNTTRLAEGLLTEKLDEDCRPVPVRKTQPQVARRPRKTGISKSMEITTVVDTDRDDDDFAATDSDSESDSETSALGDKEEYVMHNDEVNLLIFLLLIFNVPYSKACRHASIKNNPSHLVWRY